MLPGSRLEWNCGHYEAREMSAHGTIAIAFAGRIAERLQLHSPV